MIVPITPELGKVIGKLSDAERMSRELEPWIVETRRKLEANPKDYDGIGHAAARASNLAGDIDSALSDLRGLCDDLDFEESERRWRTRA